MLFLAELVQSSVAAEEVEVEEEQHCTAEEVVTCGCAICNAMCNVAVQSWCKVGAKLVQSNVSAEEVVTCGCAMCNAMCNVAVQSWCKVGAM